MWLTAVGARAEGRDKKKGFKSWLYMRDICITVASVPNLCVTREERFMLAQVSEFSPHTGDDRKARLTSHTAGEEGRDCCSDQFSPNLNFPG